MTQIKLSNNDLHYLRVLEDLNAPQGDGLLVGLTHRLHSAQIDALRPLYEDNCRILMLPCGRKFGKSEVVGYVLWRQALFYPGSMCYYIAPERTQGREIMWNNKRLQTFIGKASDKYIDKISDVEMKITFLNGSVIKILGSENWAAANGLTPSIAVYDEYKVFHPKWHTEFDPNRAAKAAPLVIIGTMPKVGDCNKEEYEAMLNYCSTNKDCAVKIYTSFDNPINQLPNQKAALEAQIARLEALGEHDVVQREYFSRIVPGGSRAVFPMLNEQHVKPHDVLMAEIAKDAHKLEWFCIADPGTTTRFGVLFGCLNPYTKQLYILDEIYEGDQRETSTLTMYPKIVEKAMGLHGNWETWLKGYDEAAAWFSNEVLNRYGIYFQPTDKNNNKKEVGISLIKDLLVFNKLVMSDRCVNLFKEMTDYAKDDKGEIPKRKGIYDHLIDCLRYTLSLLNYTIVEGTELIKPSNPQIEFVEPILERRGIVIEEKHVSWDDFEW